MHDISPSGRILVVDDHLQNLRLLERWLTQEGYSVATAANGREALGRVAGDPPDLILLDVMMPGLDGFEVCRRLKSDPATRLIPVVLITGTNGREDRLKGIQAGAEDFLGKPIDREELRARLRALMLLKRHTDELDSAESVIVSLALTIESRDPLTNGHCQRLARYALELADHLGLRPEERDALRRGAFLHDIGKVAVRDAVLHKPAALTAEEMAEMKRHVIIGDSLCSGMRLLRPVRPIIRHHHERFDGSGYPDGLRGEAIPLLARIIGIVDVYDALTTNRPYRAALSVEQGFEILREEVARGWHQADLVEAFIDLRRQAGAIDRPV